MKKIAIVTRKMIAGGIEKSLISMLEAIPKDEFEITLFVMSKGGEFEEFIPKHVKVRCIFGEESTTKEKIINNFKKYKLKNIFKILFYTTLALRTKKVSKQEEYFLKISPQYNEVYDLAIAYHTPASLPVKYLSDYLNAHQKIAWIHSDIEEYKEEMQSYIDYYKEFKTIFCVSKIGLEKFNRLYPNLSNRTQVFYNIVNKNQLINLANEGESFNDNFQGLRILTVGRLTSEKGYDIIPKIVSKLKEEGFDFRWYCIGDGELRNLLEEKIIQYDLQQHLILLGTKTNPYPYYKNCDIYVQTSRHEGYCITLAEARLFNKPIVTTDFLGAREQIINNSTGKIVSFNEIELENTIKQLFISEKNRIKYILNLEKENSLDNEKANINKILKLCSKNI